MARKCLLRLACLACLLAIAGMAQAQDYEDIEEQPVARNTRVRRQQGGGRVQVPQPGAGAASPSPAQSQPPAAPPGVNLQGGLQTGAMALSSSLDAQAPGLSVGASNQARPPPTGMVNPQAPPLPNVEDQPVEMVRPMRKKRPRVRPTKPVYDDAYDDGVAEEPERRRGGGGSGGRRDENEDEYCDDDNDSEHDDDDDDGYGHLFRPMRHMTRMMGGIMNQMQGMASNGFSGNFPTGSNMAMAQSMSNSDGYSRLSSLVNNNGRTRGVVSETRNGRTQTRRIGGSGGGDEDEEEE